MIMNDKERFSEPGRPRHGLAGLFTDENPEKRECGGNGMKRKRFLRRAGGLLLACSLLLSALPAAAAADNSLTVTAVAEDPLVVREVQSDIDLFAGEEGSLQATIDRDYSQEIKVQLKNPGDTAVAYFLTVENPYSDLSMNFVDPSTSRTAPVSLAAGAEAEATLAIFAQEAEETSYADITLTCHIVGSGVTSRKLELTVTGDGMKLESSTEQVSGDLLVTLTNNGPDVNSLKVFADEALSRYVFFPEPVMNYALKSGASVTFHVSPTQALNDAVSGKLLAKGNGATVEIPVTLSPADAKAVTGRELALADNPLAGAEADPDSLAVSDTGVMSYHVTYGQGEQLPIAISVQVERTDTLVEDDGTVNARINGIQMEATAISGSSVTFSFSHLMTAAEFEALTGLKTNAVLLAGDTEGLANVLAHYSITVDLSDTDLNADELAENFNNAVEDSARLSYINNLPDLPANIRDQYTATMQLSMLLELLEKDKSGKYDAFKEKLAEEINKQYQPPVDDPIKLLQDTLDKLQDSLEKKIIRKYPEFQEKVREDEFKPIVSDKTTQETAKDDDNSEGHGSIVTIEEKGHQCTNRGAITSEFYTKDQHQLGYASLSGVTTAADMGVRVFYTGRIVSEDKYVNFEPITYALMLNGKPVGESRNSGLSELNIIELDPSYVLLGQANSFTRDYDVNPGTHFVNTDNRFTVVYPEDMAVLSTAAGPVEAALPDFDVYRKNIFAVDGDGNYVDYPVAGENTLHVSVSNRGAHGGYYQLTVSCDGTTLVSDADSGRYRYLSAFSGQTLKLDGVNLTAGDNDITVTITDCSGRTHETRTENNSATMTLTARERQVPKIDALTPSGNVTSPVMLSAKLSNDLDVVNVEFLVDGVSYYAAANKSEWTYGPTTLENGSHTCQAVVTYRNGAPNSSVTGQVKSEQQSFTVGAVMGDAWADVTLPEGAAVTLSRLLSYDAENNMYQYSSGYSLTKNAEGTGYVLSAAADADLSGLILVAYDGVAGKLYAAEVGAKGTALTLSADRTLTLSNGTFGNNYMEVWLPGLDLNLELAVTHGSNTLQLPALNLKMYGRVQATDGVSLWIDADIDLTSGNQTYDLTQAFKTYTFQTPAESGSNWECSYVYSYDRYSSTRYNSTYMNTSIDGHTLTAVLSKNNVRYEPKEAWICLYTNYSYGSEQPCFYVIPEASYQTGMSLAGQKTSKLSFSGTGSDLEITDVQLAPSTMGGHSFSIHGDQITSVLCTPGTYTVAVSFTYNGAQYSLVRQNVDLTVNRTIDLSVEALTAVVKISWPQSMGNDVNVNVTNQTTGMNMEFSSISNGGTIKMVPGTYDFWIGISAYSDGTSFYADFNVRDKQLPANQTAEIVLGSTFSGTLTRWQYDTPDVSCLPGSQLTLRLEDLTDENGNGLDYCSSRPAFEGYVVFTDENGKSVSVPVSLNNLTNSFSVAAPETPGSYTMKFVTKLEQAEQKQYTITATAGSGGTISPSGKISVAEGSAPTFRITPSTGYKISSVKVDGVEQGAITSYSFQNVSANHAITAAFQLISNNSGWDSDSSDSEQPSTKPVKPRNPFTDINEETWCYEDVMTVYENGLFNGTTATTFSPNATMTRAMFVTVLSRLENKVHGTEITGQAAFTDVLPDMWYTDGVQWAADNAIAQGFLDGSFGIRRNVTREQACAFFVRYLRQIGYDLTPYQDSQSSFTDEARISSWAKEAVGIAQAMGLVNGRADGSFGPQDPITRGACAAMYHRLMNLLEQE